METVVDKRLDEEKVANLRQMKETLRGLREEFGQLEGELQDALPHFKEWTIRKTDLQPVWHDFDELFKADYHGTDHEVYEVIVDPQGRLMVTRL